MRRAISTIPPMLLRCAGGLLVCLLFLPRTLLADDDDWEKISALSPDKKFAMRVRCDSKPDDPENIETGSIKAVEIVSLPKKDVVGTLPTVEYGGFRLIWSSDSRWCAFYSMSGPRVGNTLVYRWRGGEFVPLETGEMNVPVKGDARNQYVQPVRWLKPATLVLKQHTIFRGEGGDSSIEFTVRIDESGKFRVISKRTVR